MNIQIIKHQDILFRDVIRAISVKSVAWPYPIESQFKWIFENMQPEDAHLFLYDEDGDKAYMTLSPVSGVLNGKRTMFMGIGCVCSYKQGKGYGSELIKEANLYLKNNGFPGLLFCKQGVLNFYIKNDWQVVSQDKLIASISPDIYTLVYNCTNIDSLFYSGRSF